MPSVTMRKLFVLSALLPCVAILAGCPKKKDAGGDAGDEAAAPVAVVDAAPAAPAAKNANDVARFPNAEKALTDDDQKLVDTFTTVRTGCKSGNVVATVKAGTDPFKIADFQDCILATFPDPKDPNGTLMGWIPKAAFTTVTIFDAGVKDASKDATVDAAVADAAPSALKCPTGQEAIVNLGQAATCRKKCTVDKDCKTASAGACATATTAAGKLTKVCASELP
jgi:hypothetical protein